MIRRKIAFFILLFTVSRLSAQNVNDAGMWNAFSFSANIKDITPWKDPKLFKDMSVHIDPEMRFDENISRLYGYFADIGTDKKWSKYFLTSVEYRIGAKSEENWYNLRTRWSFGAQLSLPFKKFKFSAMTRYQVAKVITSDLDLRSTWRQKMSLEYSPLKNFGIQMSHELFIQPITLENTNWRSQISLKYKLDKSNTISLGYLVQRDLTNADIDFIILTGFKWELSKKKEKAQIVD